jgi:O-antigen/teichoic acid export membrane protein
MGIPRIVARNIFANWYGLAVETAAGFVVAPFLVRSLGDATYGLWILIASLTGYFGLLDLGVRGSAGRYIAFYRAKSDSRGVNSIFNTALAFLAGAALLAWIGTFGVRLFFFHLFPQVAPDQVSQADLALAVVGWNLALTLLLSLFDATLWALQRFDLLNAVDIPFVIVRAVLIFTLVGRGNDLVVLAGITLGVTAGRGLAKAVLAFLVEPSLRVNGADISRAAFRQLLGYGLWHFLLSVSRLAHGQIGPLLIGLRLTIDLVTPYAIAARLIGYASSVLISATGVLTPLAASFDAEESRDRQRTLFLEGSKYCAALAFFFFTLFLCLGRPLLRLWMGPLWQRAFPLLVILAIGEALPMAQWVTQSMILGMGRHSWLALLGLGELGVGIPLALVLMADHGLAGLCIAFAVPGMICRGVIPMLFGCRLVRIPVRELGRQALVPSLMVAGLPALGLGLLVAWKAPDTWLQLVAYTGVYGVGLGLAGLFLLGPLALTRSPRAPGNAAASEAIILAPGNDGTEVLGDLPPSR